MDFKAFFAPTLYYLQYCCNSPTIMLSDHANMADIDYTSYNIVRTTPGFHVIIGLFVVRYMPYVYCRFSKLDRYLEITRMSEVATIQSVQDYLVNEYGWPLDDAQRFMHDYADIVNDSIRLGSFTYYIASEIRHLRRKKGV